jgi:hypothetical protein
MASMNLLVRLGSRSLQQYQKMALERAYAANVQHTARSQSKDTQLSYSEQTLTPKGLRGYASTSGTTDTPKIIPINESYLQSLRKSWFLWGLQVYAHHPHLLLRKTWNFATHHQKSFQGHVLADMSYWVGVTQRLWVRASYVFGRDDLVHEDLELNYTHAAKALIEEGPRLGMLISTTPASFLRIAQILGERGALFLKELADSRKISRKRKQNIEHALDQSNGVLLASDLLPADAIVATWLGGSFQHYIPRLTQAFGPRVLWDLGYCATEGHFTIPFQPMSCVGVPVYWDYHFRFFNSKGFFELHEIKEGEEYEIVVSGPHGFVHFPMNDIVRCEGTWHGIPLLNFIAKTAHFFDLSGEKISSWQFAKALKDARIHHHVRLCPNESLDGYKVLSKNFIDPNDLDIQLQTLNFTYREHRQSHRLRPLVYEYADVSELGRLREKPDFFDSALFAANSINVENRR